MVPDGWKVYKVDGIASSDKNAMSTGPFGSAISSKYFTEKGIPVIRGGNLSNKHDVKFIEKGFIFVSEEKAKEFKRSVVTSGDLIFTCWGTINQIGIIPQKSSYPYYIISNKQMKLSINESIAVPEYIYTLFSSYKLQHKIKSEAIGSSVPGFNLGQLKSISLTLPPLPEQQKIAKILSTWDKAIGTTERLIENSKQQKKSLMQQLLTGKKRLLDDEGKRFEGEWEDVRLDQVVSIGRGYAFKSEQYSECGYKIVRVTNIDSSGNIDLTDCVFIPENTAKEFSKYQLKDEDILLVMVGATVGKLGFVDDSILPALLNQNMWSLRTSNSHILYQEFLKHISSYIIARYMLTQQGSARGFFTQSTFSLVKFSIPNNKEQQKIATVLTNADKEIELLEQKLADLQQEKKALMQVLLTGKKRVVV